jgi:HEAT repeat protein
MNRNKTAGISILTICFFCLPIREGSAWDLQDDLKIRNCEEISINIFSRSEKDKKIDELIAAFGTSDWEKAVDELARIGEPAVKPLSEALIDYSGHRYKPQRAALALGKIGSSQAEEALIRALRDESTQDYVARRITRSLAEIGSDQAELALIEVVRDKALNRFIRGPAADALSRFNTDRSISVLIETLDDEEEFVRNFAGGSLAKIGSKKSMDALLIAMKKYPGFLLNPSVREAVEKDQSEQVIGILVDALKSEEWFIWQSATDLLAKTGILAETQLLAAMDSQDTRTRRKAALLLGESRSAKAVDRLILALEDRDPMVRDEAAVALTKIESLRAVELLIEGLQKGTRDIQQQVCWILGELKAEQSVESLLRVLDHKDPEMRLWATDALQKISSPQAMKALQESQPFQIIHEQHFYEVYPVLLKNMPDIPSPYRADSGIETVTAFTLDGQYTLVPVTIENGHPYIYLRSDKGRQLKIDAPDFPILARTGLHSEDELKTTKTITGISISEITDNGRPGRSSGAGFMSHDENIISVMIGDNRLVEKMDLTHPQLARALFHAVNLMFKHTEVYYDEMRPWEDIEYFLYNGKKVRIEIESTKGWQESIFDDEIYGGYHLNLKRDLEDKELTFLQEKYSGLSDEQQDELINKLANIHTGEMEPYYIMRYGFYEGHTEYRTDPITLAFIFGLRTIEEIENAFPGRLYETLTAHFK